MDKSTTAGFHWTATRLAIAALLALGGWLLAPTPDRANAQAAWSVLGAGAADPPTFRKPTALTVDAAGSLYVIDAEFGFVIRATTAGEYAGAWGRPLNVQQIAKPSALTIGPDDSVYVADLDTRAVHHLSPDGTLLSSWEVGTPSSLALDATGNLYVGYGGGLGLLENKYSLQELSPTGEQLGRWIFGVSGGGGSPSRGTASGVGYRGISAVAIDPTGRVLFLHERSSYQRDKLREESHTWAELKTPEPGIPAWSTSSVRSILVAGDEVGDGPARFKSPSGLAVDLLGNIYVADTGNHRVQKLAPDGTFLAQWGGEGSAPGQFRSPTGIAVDASGNLYVADTGNQRVQVLDAASAQATVRPG